MQNKKYLELDALAAPNGYVAPPTKEDLAYVVHFRKTCQRYQIDFAKADPDERDFVIHMAEKIFRPDTPDPDSDPYGKLTCTQENGQENLTMVWTRT